MAAHWYNQGNFIKIPMPQAHLQKKKSILIDLKWGMDIDFF